jgi:hypothetical protein
MAQTLERSAIAIQQRIEKLKFTPGIASTVRQNQLRLVLAEIRKTQQVMWTHGVTSTVVSGQKAAAEAAVRAAEDLERVMYASLPETVADALRGSLSATAQAGIDRAYTRVPRELSQRVYKDFAVSSGQVESIIRTGIVSGLSAKELAADVYHFISPTVPGGASYAAQRLARTEINNAFHTQQIAGGQRPGVKAIKWNLSGSHKRPDECNQFASADNDLGVGCYAPVDVPGKPHPQCLCFMTYVTMTSAEFEKALTGGKFDNELDARIKKNLESMGQGPAAKTAPLKSVKSSPRPVPKAVEPHKPPPVSATPVDEKLKFAMAGLKNGTPPGRIITEMKKSFGISDFDALKLVNAAKKGNTAAEIIINSGPKLPLGQRVSIPGKNGDLIRSALEDQAKLVPKVADQLNGVRYGDAADFNDPGVLGVYRQGSKRIFLNSEVFGEKYASVFDREVRTQFATPCGSHHTAPQSVFNHEFGHHVHKYIDEAPRAERIAFWNNVERELGIRRSSGSIDFDSLTRWLKDNQGAVTAKVSRYGSTNPHELLAEIWQEYSSKGTKARPHIQAIGRMMQEFAERSVT